MKSWLKISIAFCIILLSVGIFIYLKSISLTVSKTGQLILLTGTATSLIAGVSVVIYILFSFIKQTGKEKDVIEEKKTRKDASSEFFEGLVNNLYKISRDHQVTDDEVESVINDARKAVDYGVKPAKWFVYASFKSVRYVIEYLSKENHIIAMMKMIEQGTPSSVIGKYLKNHVLEHYQIKDSHDIHLAEKYLK